jgi:hypothetical protein
LGDWLISNAPAAPTPSVAPKRSKLSASTEEFHPASLAHLSGVQWPSTPISSTSQNENGSLDATTHPPFSETRLSSDRRGSMSGIAYFAEARWMRLF